MNGIFITNFETAKYAALPNPTSIILDSTVFAVAESKNVSEAIYFSIKTPEVEFGSAAYLAVSKFVMNMPFNQNEMIKKLGVLILADVIAETFTRVIDDII